MKHVRTHQQLTDFFTKPLPAAAFKNCCQLPSPSLSILPSLPLFFTPALPPSLPPLVFPSLPPSLSHSLSFSIPPSLPPSPPLFLSLFLFLPSLPPSLPPNLPPLSSSISSSPLSPLFISSPPFPLAPFTSLPPFCVLPNLDSPSTLLALSLYLFFSHLPSLSLSIYL